MTEVSSMCNLVTVRGLGNPGLTASYFGLDSGPAPNGIQHHESSNLHDDHSFVRMKNNTQRSGATPMRIPEFSRGSAELPSTTRMELFGSCRVRITVHPDERRTVGSLLTATRNRRTAGNQGCQHYQTNGTESENSITREAQWKNKPLVKGKTGKQYGEEDCRDRNDRGGKHGRKRRGA